MAAEILRYVLVNRQDEEGDYEYSDFGEAVKDARQLDSAVIQRTYVYDDSELAWTPDGSDMWPPSDYYEHVRVCANDAHWLADGVHITEAEMRARAEPLV